jgi:Domain of unknown function (DUF4157)
LRAEPQTTRHADRPRERPTEPPTRPHTAPARATGARGTHDATGVPVTVPREVALWRRPAAPATASSAATARRRPLVQTKLRVSRPGDALEREADTVAARVMVAATPVARALTTAPAARVARRAEAPIRGPPPTGLAHPTTTVPRQVESVIAASRGGLPIDPLLRALIEPHVGADLSAIHVRAGPDANAAARALGARAFASGDAIYLAAGESPRDVALIAHEAAHIAQQQVLPSARAQVLRQSESGGLGDISITDWVPEQIRGAARAIPGYEVLSAIAGRDLLTGRPAAVSREQLIEKLLSYGPFGAAVGPVLTTIGVLDDVFTLVSEGLTANNLTLARLERDVDAAWAEVSITNSLDANVAIVRRYIEALLRDVRAFVGGIVDRVIAIVRSAIASVAAPLLETPQIKPVWDLARKVMRYDPLRGRPVEASTVEILGDFLRLIGKEKVLEQMTERGTLQETADWIDTQLATFAGLVGELGTLFSDAWAAIQPANLPQILDALPQLAARAFSLIGRVADFASTVIGKVLELIKRSLLGWLSEYAHGIPGFHLVTVIIERNPFTDEPVPRTAENLIKGFVTLMPGGKATYEQLAESGVITEAATRIETAMATLGISWEMITTTFRGIWDSLSLEDLLDPIAAFARIVARFGEPISRLFEFIGVVVEVIVSLVLQLMSFPSELLANIIANVQRAIADIQRDPIAFILNMIEALKAGFMGFFDRIGTYLLQGLADWLFRGLGQLGITVPTDFTLPSVLQLVLQVLGLSIETLWTKLGAQIGPERVGLIRGAIDHLTGAWAFVQDVQQRGLVAVWEYVAEQLSGLWDTLLQMAQDWIVTTIVNNVVARLISMLDPTGVMAVVNSFIAFFRAAQSAIEYLREILQIVDMYVSTVAQIAAGNIQPGAEMVERGLAAAIPIAIGFLANQVGIGNIPEKIVEIIGRLRQIIDQAIDWLIAQAIRLRSAALNALDLGARPDAAAQAATGTPAVAEGEFVEFDTRHRVFVDTTKPGRAEVMVNPVPLVDLTTYIARLKTRVTNLPQNTPTEAEQRMALLGRIGQLETEATQASAEARALFGERSEPRARQPATLDRRITRLAAELNVLMDLTRHGVHTGERDDPIPIRWHKRMAAYESIQITQHGRPRTLDPGLHHLPHPTQIGVTEWIGIGSASRPDTLLAAGRNITRASRPLQRPRSGSTETLRRTLETEKFEDFLGAFAWVKPGGWAIDHVQDLSFSGGDDLDNMWPVEASVNVGFNRTIDQPVARWARVGGAWELDRSTPKQLPGLYFYVAELG